MEDREERQLLRLTYPQRVERDLHVLEGIIDGIAVDRAINPAEISALRAWCSDHREVTRVSPYREIMERLHSYIADGVLDFEEREDLKWLLNRPRSPSAYYDVATSDLQRLHGVLVGIASDGVITEAEGAGVLRWLSEVDYLQGAWPYDEVVSLLHAVLADGRIDPLEHRALVGFCREFAGEVAHLLVHSLGDEESIRFGVCASDPEITFAGRRFCITGKSPSSTRRSLHDVVTSLGGLPQPNVTQTLDYLVICDAGNGCWAYSCYGRKVETAVTMRRSGHRVALVRETDFWDAVRDHGRDVANTPTKTRHQ